MHGSVGMTQCPMLFAVPCNTCRPVLPANACGDGSCNVVVSCCALQQAKQLCRDITKAIRTLEKQRDMNVNEIKLIIAIEDPRSRERREAMGIEASRGSGVGAGWEA